MFLLAATPLLGQLFSSHSLGVTAGELKNGIDNFVTC